MIMMMADTRVMCMSARDCSSTHKHPFGANSDAAQSLVMPHPYLCSHSKQAIATFHLAFFYQGASLRR